MQHGKKNTHTHTHIQDENIFPRVVNEGFTLSKPELVIGGTVERLTMTVLMSFTLFLSRSHEAFYDHLQGKITVFLNGVWWLWGEQYNSCFWLGGEVQQTSPFVSGLRCRSSRAPSSGCECCVLNLKAHTYIPWASSLVVANLHPGKSWCRPGKAIMTILGTRNWFSISKQTH